jgi:hypothetical protein
MFFASLNFFKCVYAKSHFSTTSFVGCQIHFGKFYFPFCTRVVAPMKEVQLVVVIDDLDFGIKDVVFEAKVLNRHDTFDRIANRSMKDPIYAYLHCDLLNMVALTTISFKVKSLHIDMYE